MGREATANNPSCHGGAPEWSDAIGTSACRALGLVGNHYVVLQNRDGFAFFHDRDLWTGSHGVGEATGLITRRDDAVLTACAGC